MVYDIEHMVYGLRCTVVKFKIFCRYLLNSWFVNLKIRLILFTTSGLLTAEKHLVSASKKVRVGSRSEQNLLSSVMPLLIGQLGLKKLFGACVN